MSSSFRRCGSDGTTTDVYRDVSIGLVFSRDIIKELSIGVISRRREWDTHRSQTTTTIDRALHRSAVNIHHHITASATSRQGYTTEATTTTEDVTIHVGSTSGTNCRSCMILHITNRYSSITQYVTILTATEDRTVDDTAFDVNYRLLHVCPGVEENTLVTLTCTEEIAGHRVCRCISVCTRNANRTARHVDGTLTT